MMIMNNVIIIIHYIRDILFKLNDALNIECSHNHVFIYSKHDNLQQVN